MAFEKYKPAARSTILDTNATTNLGSLDGKALIEKTLEAGGLSIEQLATEIGYAARTLRGVRYGEIPTSAKLVRALQTWWDRYTNTDPNLREVSPFYGIGEEEDREIGGHSVRVIHPIERGTKPVQPAARVLTAPLDKAAENVNADLMIELLQDYKSASVIKRKWLAGHIRDLAMALGGANETTPSPSNR